VKPSLKDRGKMTGLHSFDTMPKKVFLKKLSRKYKHMNKGKILYTKEKRE